MFDYQHYCRCTKCKKYEKLLRKSEQRAGEWWALPKEWKDTGAGIFCPECYVKLVDFLNDK